MLQCESKPKEWIWSLDLDLKSGFEEWIPDLRFLDLITPLLIFKSHQLIIYTTSQCAYTFTLTDCKLYIYESFAST